MAGRIVEIVHVPVPGFVNIWREGDGMIGQECGQAHPHKLETVWYHDTQHYELWVKKAEQFNK
jgi:hypothetical protein